MNTSGTELSDYSSFSDLSELSAMTRNVVSTNKKKVTYRHVKREEFD